MEVRTPVELFYEICYIYWWSPFSVAPFTWLRFVAENCKSIKSLYRAVSWTSICVYIYIIHLIVCLTTGPKLLPKRALHIVRSRASPFKWEYPLLYLRSSSSFIRLLPPLPVTSIAPFIFPSISCCRRQFLRKIWPIHETSKRKANWMYISVCMCYSECFVYVGHSIFAI
jgi:hypothetical protein